jgi:RNA recognition motif-containing protein
MSSSDADISTGAAAGTDNDSGVGAAEVASTATPAPRPHVDLFVGNLSLYTEPPALKNYFGKFGQVEDVRIMYHADTKKSRRFGFVTFADPTCVNAVMAFQPGHFLDGKNLETNLAVKREDDGATREGVESQAVSGAGVRPRMESWPGVAVASGQHLAPRRAAPMDKVRFKI